jgi:AbrB family looped-hinge helix DNA binding protein
MASKAETVMSTKGQVIVPKEIRDSLNWRSGTRLTFEKTPAGVLVKEAAPEKTGSIEDIFGILKYDGPPVSIEEMDQAIADEVARRHAAGRF